MLPNPFVLLFNPFHYIRFAYCCRNEGLNALAVMFFVLGVAFPLTNWIMFFRLFI